MNLNSTEHYIGTFLNNFPSPQKTSTKGHECDDIALLLDNVPELDSAFVIKKKIGYGTFSSVYLGHLKPKLNSTIKNYYAIKHIIPTSHPSRIFMELKCLKLVGGKNNIIEATLCLRNMNHIVLVMPYFSHDTFGDYVGNLTPDEVRDYMFNLLQALEKVHGYNIIHRDIKPSNFLYSRRHRRYALIDFGLAQDLNKNTKSQSSSKYGVERKFSCPLMETPQMTLSRPVKRKLTVPFISSPDTPSGVKKPRLTPPTVNISPNNAVFAVASRINSNLVVCASSKSSPHSRNSHKENTPLMADDKQETIKTILNDSPSKHTRQAVAFRTGKNGSKNDSWKDNCTPYKKISSPNKNALRRSPRKLNSNGPKFIKGVNSSVASSGSYARNSIENYFAASTSGYSVSGAHPSDHDSSKRISSSFSKEVKTRSGRSILCPTSCRCYGSAKVCSLCLGRKNQHAPRAGTPGFRAPEILIRHPNQTTAVDVWSAGVILLCLASGRYPFFSPVDDLSSLAEITTIFGTRAIKKISANLGKLFTSSEDVPPLDLKKICKKLRKQSVRSSNPEVDAKRDEKDSCKGCKQFLSECVCLTLPTKNFFRLDSSTILGSRSPRDSNISYMTGIEICGTPQATEESLNPNSRKEINYPSTMYDLLYRLLDPYPDTRISAKDALLHPFFVQSEKN